MKRPAVDEETVKKVAKISRINLTQEEAAKFSKDLESILDAFRILQKADTKGLKPSFHPIPLKERTREDKIEEGLSQSEALSNSRKNKEKGYFKGPRAI